MMKYKIVLTFIAIFTAFNLPTRVIKPQADGVKISNITPSSQIQPITTSLLTKPTVSLIEQEKPSNPSKIAPQPQGMCAELVVSAGIGDVQNALTLIARESGCRVGATNGATGAYGIPQALPGSKMATAGDDWQTNPVTQLRWMNTYVLGRYGSWENALAHSYNFNWY